MRSFFDTIKNLFVRGKKLRKRERERERERESCKAAYLLMACLR